MTRLKFLFLLIFAIYSLPVFAQLSPGEIAQLDEKYRNFEYSEVIKLADKLLKIPAISAEDSVQILTIKAASCYSLNLLIESSLSYVTILKINKFFILDTSVWSPKIIEFFNEIKRDYLKKLEDEKTILSKTDTVRITTVVFPDMSYAKESILKSILLPGLGHLDVNPDWTAYSLLAVSGLSLLSSVYFTLSTNSSEKEYLNEFDPLQISSKYDTFNKNYQLRNISIAVFAATWLYAQLDLLLGTTLFSAPTQNIRITPSPDRLSLQFLF
jgi:hypothetical protein